MRSIIIGAGTYGEVYLDYLQEAGVEVAGFVDDNPQLRGREVRGVPVLGGCEALQTLGRTHGIEAVYCPLGNNRLRAELLAGAEQLGYAIPNFIHPSVCVSPNVRIGKGVYILLGTNIMPHTTIEDFVMISMNANIAHHSLLQTGTFISTGVNLGASINAHQYTYIGIGATIMTGVHELGQDCLIGAGAVVIRDVPERAVMAGVPARIVKYKE